jgi:tRNA (cmo5U34)-methyltransferase
VPEFRSPRVARHIITRDEYFFIAQDNYDEHIELAIPFYRFLHQELIRIVPPTDEPLRVLDLGCGTGKTSAMFLENFPKSTVRGIDLFEEMLKHARNRLARFKDRMVYTQGDFREVDLGSGYDVCVSALAIHHQLAEEKRESFDRIFQALAPNGKFLMIDWTRFRSHALRSIAAEVAEQHVAESVPKPEIVRDWIEHWRQKNLPETVEDLIAWLLEAGFSSAECVTRFYGIALICAEKGT